MASYSYRAKDHSDREVLGQIEARDAAEARRLVEEQGLAILEIRAIESAVPGDVPQVELSASEAEQVAEQVSLLSKTGFPLAPGLRAVAEESDSPRLAQALSWLADQIEQGRSLDEAMVAAEQMLPRHMKGLIAAAVHTGQLGAALNELAEHQRAVAALRRGVFSVLAYPALVAGLATVVFLLITMFLAAGWKRIFDEFGMRLPMLTQAFFWWCPVAPWLIGGLLVGLAIVLVVVRPRLGRARWERFLAVLPVLGPMWHWSALAEWCGLLLVLIRHQIVLPEALRLAADGVSSARVGELSLAMAEGVCRGRSLSQTISAHRQMPALLATLVRWGEKTQSLEGSLAAGREMLEESVRMRAFWLQAILPPLLFIAIGCGAFLVIGALFVPLTGLVSSLSG